MLPPTAVAALTRFRRLLAAGAALLTLAACAGDPVASGEPRPAGPRAVAVRVEAGDVQVGAAGRELGEPLRVQVVDEAGRALPNYVVNFRVVAGGGSVFAGAAMTDANGRAADYWTLGPASADTQRVEVRAVDPATGERRVYATFRALAVEPGDPLEVGGDTLRFVVTWTRGPQDLDLVLTGPTSENQRFEVSSVNFGNCAISPWACKDGDIQSIPGRETITLVRQLPGLYQLSVFNFSSDAAIDPSGTKVEVYSGTRLLRTIVPPAGAPRQWVVLELQDGVMRTAEETPSNAVASVTVSPSPVSLVVGAQQRLTAEVRDAAGTILVGRTVTWTSSAPAIVTVDSNGTARALGAGTVEITATSEGKRGTATIRAVAGGSRFLAIVSENPINVRVGARASMRARVTDGLAPIPGATVTWLQAGWEPLTMRTDANGEVAVALPTDRAGTFTGRAQLTSGTTVERTVTYSYTVDP